MLIPIRCFLERDESPAGGREDPHRLREGIHNGGSDEVQRFQGGRDGGRGESGGEVQAAGQELRGRRRRHNLLQIQRWSRAEGRQEEMTDDARFRHGLFIHQHDFLFYKHELLSLFRARFCYCLYWYE